jgi:hypothetical protein
VEHGVVAPPGAGGAVRGGEQRVCLGLGEVGDQGLVCAFGGDGQDAGDEGGVLGVAQRRVAESGVDRGEPRVAGPDAVAAVFSRWSRKAETAAASRSAMSSRDGGVPARLAVKASSSRQVSR